MLLYIVYNVYNRIKKNNEHFDNDKKNKSVNTDKIATLSTVILDLIFFISAAYVSFTCNKSKGETNAISIFYAIFAGSFGMLYLLLHFMVVKLGIPCQGI